MIKRKILFTFTAVVMLMAAAVLARRTWAQGAVEKKFDQLDRNKDGKVTPAELPAAEIFKRLDLDGNGEITKPEVAKAHKLSEFAKTHVTVFEMYNNGTPVFICGLPNHSG